VRDVYVTGSSAFLALPLRRTLQRSAQSMAGKTPCNGEPLILFSCSGGRNIFSFVLPAIAFQLMKKSG